MSHQTGIVAVERFHLSHLAEQNRLNAPQAWQQFQAQSDLADLYWEASYYQDSSESTNLSQALQQADGIVIFLHGCNGSHQTWEELPQQLVAQYPHVVCLNPDIYGFGESPLKANRPPFKQVSMAAAMATIELWLDLIGLGPTAEPSRFYLFVGHSMGGGMLFYQNESFWQHSRYGCYLLSPSIFCNDWLRGLLYQLIGLGVMLPYIGPIKRKMIRWIIRGAMGGASTAVREEHGSYSTPYSTIMTTMCGIGQSPRPTRLDWSPYRLVMGHQDVVVSPTKIISFVQQLGFKPHQIKVLLGDHYLFSYDDQSPITHRHSRQLILTDLVNFCQQLVISQADIDG